MNYVDDNEKSRHEYFLSSARFKSFENSRKIFNQMVRDDHETWSLFSESLTDEEKNPEPLPDGIHPF